MAGGPGSLFDGPSTGASIDAGALVPATGGTIFRPTGGLVGGEYWRLLSSMFLHAGLSTWRSTATRCASSAPRSSATSASWSTLAVYFVTGVPRRSRVVRVRARLRRRRRGIGRDFGVLGAFIVYNYRGAST